MNKNSKETMNKRTHNPFKRYQQNKKTDSNYQAAEEFGDEFEITRDKQPKQKKKLDRSKK